MPSSVGPWLRTVGTPSPGCPAADLLTAKFGLSVARMGDRHRKPPSRWATTPISRVGGDGRLDVAGAGTGFPDDGALVFDIVRRTLRRDADRIDGQIVASVGCYGPGN